MTPFLTIDSEARLSLIDMDNENKKPIIFDINADYDGSVKSLATFMDVNGIESMWSSSTLDDSDDYGIDSVMLDSFFVSVSDYAKEI